MENLNLAMFIAPAVENMEGPVDHAMVAQQSRHVHSLYSKILDTAGPNPVTDPIVAEALKRQHILVTRAAGFDAAPPWAQELHGMH